MLIRRNSRNYFQVLSGCLFTVVLLLSLPSTAAIDIRMQTDLGGIDIILRDDLAPLTVDNFLDYMNAASYDGTFIHRNIPGFVVQGGGYIYNPADGAFFGGGTSHIPENDPVINEAGLPGALSNIRGTLAMAKEPGDPDSAKSEWFFNTVDNSGDLDNQNGGFTVFAEVTGDGLDVVDNIAEQDVCTDVIGLGFLCQDPFRNTIFVGAGDVNFLPDDMLLLVQYIDFDSDNDGVVDRAEDEAPNAGDGNQDGIKDRVQQEVASFRTQSGAFATIESQSGIPMSSSDVMGLPFVTSTDPTEYVSSLDFQEIQFGTILTGLAAGAAVTLELSFSAAIVPNSFYVYGPTSDNPVSHWYEFLYDGETGALINGNRITLYYVDGKRGDADMAVNGVVQAAPGGPVIKPGDNDGIPDDIENSAPNNGDGNNDGIADSAQSNVASLLDINDVYVTVEADPALTLQSLDFTDGTELITPENFPSLLKGYNLANGFLRFEASGLNPGDATTVSLYLPSNYQPSAFFKYGPTPDDNIPHWYEFDFDGETGAVMNGNVVTLHFVDGKRGDADLTMNGVITDPGAPAVKAANSAGNGGGGGGGCTISRGIPDVSRVGDWCLLSMLISLLGLRMLMSQHQSGRSELA